MMFILLGPLSSGTEGGPGELFSWLFFLLGTLVLTRTWVVYLKNRRGHIIPVLNPLGISIVAVFFIGMGLYGILR